MSDQRDESTNPPKAISEREPDELTDAELEYVVGGLAPDAAIMRLQTLLGAEVTADTE